MFDVGFWELVIISIVALLVVGPERLPALIREGGRWFNTVRRFVSNTKREIERELNFDVDTNLTSKITDLENLMQEAPDRDRQPQDKTP